MPGRSPNESWVINSPFDGCKAWNLLGTQILSMSHLAPGILPADRKAIKRRRYPVEIQLSASFYKGYRKWKMTERAPKSRLGVSFGQDRSPNRSKVSNKTKTCRLHGFQSALGCKGLNDEGQCLIFLSALFGVALNWFYRLEPDFLFPGTNELSSKQ